MSRRLAGAVVALIFAGSAGSGILAIRNKPRASDAPKKAPEAAATEALNSGLKRLERADQIEPGNPKQARKGYEAALRIFSERLRRRPTITAHTMAPATRCESSVTTSVHSRATNAR